MNNRWFFIQFCLITRKTKGLRVEFDGKGTNRLETCSHDSNILKAGASPCSSMKILIKFDISSESFEILQRSSVSFGNSRTPRRFTCISKRESRASWCLAPMSFWYSVHDDGEAYDL